MLLIQIAVDAKPLQRVSVEHSFSGLNLLVFVSVSSKLHTSGRKIKKNIFFSKIFIIQVMKAASNKEQN